MENASICIANKTEEGYGRNDEKEKLNITLFLTSKTISLLGTNIYNFALSLYILKVTGSGASFAINVLIGMLPRVILGPFAGILADRVNRKKLTIIFDLFSGLTVFMLLGLSSVNGLRIIYIYITGFILSTINVFYDTALTSSLPNLVKDEKLMKINSYSTVSTSMTGMISPILAGIIYGFVPIYLFLAVNGISFIFSSAVEAFMDFNINKPAEASIKTGISFDTVKNELIEVIGFVKKQKAMYSLMKYILIINLFMGASMSVAYPYIINKVLRMSSADFGTFQGFYFIGMIVSSIIMGNAKEKRITVKGLAINLTAVGLILILTGLPTIGLGIFNIKMVLFIYNVILLFTIGVVLIKINTPILVNIQRITPENLRGRITGLMGTLAGGIAPLGILASGLLIDKVHPFLILLTAGFTITLTALNMLRSKYIDIF